MAATELMGYIDEKKQNRQNLMIERLKGFTPEQIIALADVCKAMGFKKGSIDKHFMESFNKGPVEAFYQMQELKKNNPAIYNAAMLAAMDKHHELGHLRPSDIPELFYKAFHISEHIKSQPQPQQQQTTLQVCQSLKGNVLKGDGVFVKFDTRMEKLQKKIQKQCPDLLEQNTLIPKHTKGERDLSK